MASVQFSQPERYGLAALVAAPLGATLQPDVLRIADVNPALADLLERVARGEPAVLPLRGPSDDEWLIAAATRRDLDRALVAAGRFVAPTYVEHPGGWPALDMFDPSRSDLERLGAQLYPAGFYRWRSPSGLFERILARLGRWAALERRQPSLRAAPSPSYRDLIERFSTALSTANWAAAEQPLAELRRRSLTSADNLTFLEIQLLAQQRRWADLWRRPDFRDIAQLRSPRAVRIALLTAAHQSELLLMEQQGRWAEALEAFQSIRPRLGGLLDARPDPGYGPAVRMFAYAALAGADRAAMDALLALPIDAESLAVIEALAQMLPAPRTPSQPPVEIDLRAALRGALDRGDYSGALAYAQRLDDPAERITALLDTALESGDPPVVEEALLQFYALAPETQQSLQDTSRRIRRLVELLSTSHAAPAPPAETAPLGGWLDWLAAAAADPHDPRLAGALDLVAAADDRYWSAERLALLSDRLLELSGSDQARRRGTVRDGLGRLRDYFLQDPEFPRDSSSHADICEVLYLLALEQREVNETASRTLLRLARARLGLSPSGRDTVAQHLLEWFGDPLPALEETAQDALELLADYGVQGPSLATWYRLWAEMLLGTPRQRDRAVLDGWLTLGEWVQPGADLIERLRARQGADPAAEDPVAALPSGYQIAIFTLRTESAARVSEALLRRNPGLQIRICSDKVLTDQARSLAQSAALPVVVTTCITHALTYGIGPHLRDREPVYPASDGSTSILRAIEERLRAAR